MQWARFGPRRIAVNAEPIFMKLEQLPPEDHPGTHHAKLYLDSTIDVGGLGEYAAQSASQQRQQRQL